MPHFGTNGDDTLNGNALSNYILGFSGNDSINGNGGNDIVFAGFGNDTVNGGEGRDSIWGGFGDDVVDHYVHAAEWEQSEYDRRVTDWEVARGFERA